METIITVRGQTAVPVKIRRQLGIKAHQKLDWSTNGKLIYVLPVAKDPIKTFRGSIKNISAKTLLKYRQQERRREHAREP